MNFKNISYQQKKQLVIDSFKSVGIKPNSIINKYKLLEFLDQKVIYIIAIIILIFLNL